MEKINLIKGLEDDVNTFKNELKLLQNSNLCDVGINSFIQMEALKEKIKYVNGLIKVLKESI